MFTQSFWLTGLLAANVLAQSSTTSVSSSTGSAAGSASQSQSASTDTNSGGLSTLSGTIEVTSFASATYAPIGTEQSNGVTTVDTSSTSTASNGTGMHTATTTSRGSTSTITRLVGGVGIETLSVINGTTTIFPSTTASNTRAATSTAPLPVNTQPCNNHVEFCDRKYSNITEVCAHNSAFVKKGNAASNQMYPIPDQLTDGIRMIQGEVHRVNDTMYSCHTSCDLLNAGTYQSELETVLHWVETHPFDVVTLLIVNSDYATVGVEDFVPAFEASGIIPYLYIPPKVPMHLNDWPTLSEMILTRKRVVAFMDYNANQSAVPYILDEFTHMWETPFSPQDDNFPCTIQRPPTLTNKTLAEEQFMYLANHNLNQAVTFFGNTILIPNTAALNNTNADGYDVGMLGAMTGNCTDSYNRPPNFLLVDYYNYGNVPGSVFDVAAKYNGVTYNRACCGATASGATNLSMSHYLLAIAFILTSSFFAML
ncbi:hypothetical protein MBLNU457_g0438t2 [Dothideomycetes sp. NU457]